MSLAVASIGKLLHFVGLAMGIGGSFAAKKALSHSKTEGPEARSGLEAAAAEIVTKVELPGLFLALFAGVVLITQNPDVMVPAKSGAGPWMHIKLTLVLGLLIISHLRMFNLRRLVRERADGASEADCEARHKKGQLHGMIDLALGVVIVFIATGRFWLFGG